ncbi:hypothetical protein WDW89_15375 [Deltaproteobacteria bacterium TL4]
MTQEVGDNIPKTLVAKRVVCINKMDKHYYAVEVGMENEGLMVYNFLYFTQEGADAEAAVQFGKRLKEHGFKSHIAYATFMTDEAKFERLVLLNAGDVKKLSHLKVEKNHGKPANKLYYDVRQIQTFLNKKRQERVEFLLSSVEREHVETYEDFLLRAGLKPRLIAPMNAYQNAFLNRQGTPDVHNPLSRNVDAYVYVAKGMNTVCFMQQGWFLFSREFYITKKDTSVDELDAPGLELTQQEQHRISTEVARSIQYFQQNFREYELKRIIMCGQETPRGLLQNLRVENVEITPYNEIAEVKISEFENSEVFQQNMGVFSGGLGVALGNAFEDKINFIPSPTIFQRFRFVLGPILIVLTLLCGALFTGFVAQHSSVEEEIVEMLNQIAQEQTTLIRLQEENRIRNLFFDGLTMINREAFRPYLMTEYAFKKLSQIIPPKVRLTTVESYYDKQKKKWVGILQGEVLVEGSATTARQHFERFYDALKQSPLYQNWEAKPFEVTNVSDTETKLSFELAFEITQLFESS